MFTSSFWLKARVKGAQNDMYRTLIRYQQEIAHWLCPFRRSRWRRFSRSRPAALGGRRTPERSERSCSCEDYSAAASRSARDSGPCCKRWRQSQNSNKVRAFTYNMLKGNRKAVMDILHYTCCLQFANFVMSFYNTGKNNCNVIIK